MNEDSTDEGTDAAKWVAQHLDKLELDLKKDVNNLEAVELQAEVFLGR